MDNTNNFTNLHPRLRFAVEGVQYETDQQYLTGAAIKQLAGLSPDVDLYLRADDPFNDELIENSKEVNLALPGIEGFFTKKTLKYFVDGKPFFSKSQYITGEEIKIAAGLPLDIELFLNVPEGWQDQRIGNEDRVNLARPGQERFISKRKTVIIFVNGTRYEYTGATISFEKVIEFAQVPPSSQGYLIKYNHGPHQNPKGILSRGTVVYVKDNMNFNVRSSHQS